MQCTVDGCQRPVLAKALCGPHYRRAQRHGNPCGGRTFVGEPQAFIDRAARHDGNGCLIWPYARNEAGYGNIVIGGKFRVASRVVCEVTRGPAPTENHQAAHSCGMGHRGCVSGAHLRWALPAENRADMLGHGTAPIGEKNPRSKLSLSEVRRIVAARGRESAKTIASDLGVSESIVRRIWARKAWVVAYATSAT